MKSFARPVLALSVLVSSLTAAATNWSEVANQSSVKRVLAAQIVSAKEEKMVFRFGVEDGGFQYLVFSDVVEEGNKVMNEEYLLVRKKKDKSELLFRDSSLYGIREVLENRANLNHLDKVVLGFGRYEMGKVGEDKFRTRAQARVDSGDASKDELYVYEKLVGVKAPLVKKTGK